MTYDEIKKYLSDLPPFVPVKRPDGGLIFDLDTVNELSKRLGNPQEKLKCVHIAGTNGKGSTAWFLSAIMQESGYKTGLFTSPYFSDIREQTVINGRIISEESFTSVFTEVIRASEEMKAEGFKQPSEFEMDVMASFLYFLREKCDICIIEAGLGGEYDATNVIRSPELCIFTAISRDHMSVLGETLSEIARVKAGIIKQGSECITVTQSPEVLSELKAKAEEMSASVVVAEKPLVTGAGLCGITFSMEIAGRKESFETGVSGTFQAENAGLAAEAAMRLKKHGFEDVSLDAVREALRTVKRPGRFEVISEEPLIIADGAHNAGGVEALLKSLKEIFPERFAEGRGFIFVSGVLADKEFDTMLSAAAPHAHKVFTVTPDNVRAMPAAELAKAFAAHGADAVACVNVKEALNKAGLESDKTGKPVVVFGSLYFIKEVV